MLKKQNWRYLEKERKRLRCCCSQAVSPAQTSLLESLSLHYIRNTLNDTHIWWDASTVHQVANWTTYFGAIWQHPFSFFFLSLVVKFKCIITFSKLGTPNGESRLEPALMHLIAIFNRHLGSQGPNHLKAASPSSACLYFKVINSPFYDLVTAEMPRRAVGCLVSMKTLSWWHHPSCWSAL